MSSFYCLFFASIQFGIILLAIWDHEPILIATNSKLLNYGIYIGILLKSILSLTILTISISKYYSKINLLKRATKIEESFKNFHIIPNYRAMYR